MAIGVFDSGLGGLTVHQAIAARLPDLPLVYLGDNAHAPYGVRTADDIFDLTCKGVERLWDEGCDLVILACNTASAAALKRMQETWLPADKRVLGVFVPMIEALTERAWGDNSPPRRVAVNNVALFATPATVASRAFQRELAFREALGPGVAVYSQAGLVAESLEDYLRRRPEFLGKGTQSRFLTTGDPGRVTSKATQFLRLPIRFEAA